MKISRNKQQINRRCMLAGLTASTASVGAIASTASAKPVDPHVEWFDQWKELSNQIDVCDDDSAFDVLGEKLRGLSLKICTTEATSIKGVIAQLQWFDSDFGEPAEERPVDPFWGVLGVAANSLHNIEGELV